MKQVALSMLIGLAVVAGCGDEESSTSTKVPPATAASDRAGAAASSATMPATKLEVDSGAQATSGLLDPPTTAKATPTPTPTR